MSDKKELQLEQVVPATDILEMENGYHIVMDLPGVGKDDLQIDVHDDQVTVSAKSGYVLPEHCLHKEHQAVEYRRVFTISDTVDRDRIDATFKNGVLDLMLPKAEAAMPKRIEIKTS